MKTMEMKADGYTVEMSKVVPGPRPETFFRRDRDRDQHFFFTGTGTKNDWSRSCLLHSKHNDYKLY